MTDKMRPRWLPAEWELPDAAALQAIQRGDATPEMQQRALACIVEKLAGTYEHTFVPDAQDQTTYLEGRRSVGLQIVKLLKLDLAAVRQAANNPARKGKT